MTDYDTLTTEHLADSSDRPATYNSGIGHHQVLGGFTFDRGEGDVVRTSDGRELVDLYTNESLPFGHSRDLLRQAFASDMPVNVGLYDNAWRAPVVERLAARFPGYTNFQFNTSGTLANEGLLRYAMAITGRSGLAGFVGSFHGRSKAMASASDMDWFNGERIAGYLQLPYPGYDPRTRGSVGPDSEVWEVDPEANLRRIAMLIDDFGADDLAAVMVEPILSKSVIAPPPTWLRRLRDEVLHPRGILLIADENFTAGRVGVWSSCVDQGAPADALSFSKSFSSGYPFAGLACLERHAEATDRVKGGDAGSAQAPQCEMVRLTLDRLAELDVLRHVRELERVVLDRSRDFHRVSGVTRVSAYGALAGIEFATKEQGLAAGQRLISAGVLVAVVNRGLRLTPSLTISPELLDRTLTRMVEALLGHAP